MCMETSKENFYKDVGDLRVKGVGDGGLGSTRRDILRLRFPFSVSFWRLPLRLMYTLLQCQGCISSKLYAAITE